MRRHPYFNACVDGAKNAHGRRCCRCAAARGAGRDDHGGEISSGLGAVDPTEPMPLGEHCVLGGGFFDRGNCVKVVIVPVTSASVRTLMPGQPMYEDIG